MHPGTPVLKHLPNALTLLRLAVSPAVAYALWRALGGEPGYAPWAAGLFVGAALTDLFDGMAARAFDAHSRFGRVIDPIADKALVGLPLIALSAAGWRDGWPMWPVIVLCSGAIIARDVYMTALRLMAPDGEGAKVSPLAKWKTALEMIAVGAPTILLAFPVRWSFPIGGAAWVALLATAAALSLYTAAQYLRKPAS